MAGAGQPPPEPCGRRKAPPAATFLLVLAIFPLCSSQPSPSESSAMAGLAELLQPIGPVRVMNSSDPCSWRPFVTCSGGASVSGIFLSGVSVRENTGRFFSYLCRLTSLRSLSLSDMSISSLPDEFFTSCAGLSGLSSLNLSMNLLGGSLPDFSVFSGLVELDL